MLPTADDQTHGVDLLAEQSIDDGANGDAPKSDDRTVRATGVRPLPRRSVRLRCPLVTLPYLTDSGSNRCGVVIFRVSQCRDDILARCFALVADRRQHTKGPGAEELVVVDQQTGQQPHQPGDGPRGNADRREHLEKMKSHFPRDLALQQPNETRSRFLDLRNSFLKPSLQYPGRADPHCRLVMLRSRQKASHRLIAPGHRRASPLEFGSSLPIEAAQRFDQIHDEPARPNTCMSIHWWHDRQNGRFVIGHCGKHLPNTRT
ncbi:MAG: hypothetical protein RLZZ238_1913 [Planctomycetota bacterium]